MRINRNLSTLFLLMWLQCVLSEKEERLFLLKNHKGGGHAHGGGGGGGGYEQDSHGGHGGGGYGHDSHGGHGGGGGGGGGYGDEHVYKPKKCHPQTITKYNTIYKERKAQVVNQVEILNPKPHVKVITETRYTTIRYPVFITQVIKPLLTQVETKIKPVFFTKTIDKYTTVLFTVTGIGQVTVTKVKYEKEYITRCMKKGYHHKRSYPENDGPQVKEVEAILPFESTAIIAPPTEVPHLPPVDPPKVVYKDNFNDREVAQQFKSIADLPLSSHTPEKIIPRLRKRPRNPIRKAPPFLLPLIPPRSPASLYIPDRGVNRRGEPLIMNDFNGRIGNVDDLYSVDIYYNSGESSRSGRALEASNELGNVEEKEIESFPHPPLFEVPVVILE